MNTAGNEWAPTPLPSTSGARPGVLFYSSHWPDTLRGRIDVYQLRYSLER